jgi:hypothetical protein
MNESLSTIQRALLNVFRQKGARAGDPIPESILREGVVFSGGSGQPTDLGTALLDLQFRDLVSPAQPPFTATAWVLTESGDATVYSS